MSDATPHLGLPLIAASQAQKHVTHNEALALLDALVQLACLDKDLAAPPPGPAEGDRYLVTADAPGGAWAGLAGQVVRYADGVWTGAAPRAGWLAWLVDEADLYVFDGAAWTSLRRALTALQSVGRLGINTAADASNRLAVKSDSALLTWDDATPGTGDMRVSVNRKSAARDAALVFETGYAARALLGNLGSDDFTLKVSPDGAAFATALTASARTGGIDFASAETALAAAPTTDLGAAGTRRVLVTGAGRIASFGAAADRERLVRFSGAATLVHDPEALALPTRADLVTAPDDTCIATSDAAGRWRVRHYQRADGTPLAAGAQALGANGSIRLPGGLIAQWGLVTAAEADVAVTFGIAFPGSCLGVWAQPVAGAGDALHAAQVSDVAATGFTLRTRRAAAGSVAGVGSVPTYWLALGA
ncbi:MULTISPECIES: DUF2793 domain-containing protein [Methylobacterium]|uniref:DUF2793 domain-containing protein n=1 Tax=Methylobacterium TaxID=407 RepID=UPI000733F927|nr:MULTISPECIES: DUF2793 domain-containing protein [Methylobacterium]KTS11586.1 hypothetical protein SB3_04185 [Methylobacterium radiotolerans]KTS43243.1 hypothetical protein SB2_28475 [Methylobacterium radiotolerans]MDE3746230.1 DUF2793 domain-containing protein [Methylobacterium radiotolerans]PVZ03869.1 uncharacterized protein DUF2793 [Methylobacterium organophilum]RUP18409.1 MAG: DUF2793 domain-containing protein [Methylobacterium sp.]